MLTENKGKTRILYQPRWSFVGREEGSYTITQQLKTCITAF